MTGGAVEGVRRWSRMVTRDVIALYFSVRYPGVPWYAKLLAACVAAYAFSPIDLIPDFIPVLGYLDEAIILPFGVLLTIGLIPAAVMDELRSAAERTNLIWPVSRSGAVAVVAIWLSVAGIGAWWAVWALGDWNSLA